MDNLLRAVENVVVGALNSVSSGLYYYHLLSHSQPEVSYVEKKIVLFHFISLCHSKHIYSKKKKIAT